MRRVVVAVAVLVSLLAAVPAQAVGLELINAEAPPIILSAPGRIGGVELRGPWQHDEYVTLEGDCEAVLNGTDAGVCRISNSHSNQARGAWVDIDPYVGQIVVQVGNYFGSPPDNRVQVVYGGGGGAVVGHLYRDTDNVVNMPVDGAVRMGIVVRAKGFIEIRGVWISGLHGVQPPGVVNAVGVTGAVDVSWQALRHPYLTGYRVWRSVDSSTWEPVAEVGPDDSSIRVESEPGTFYWWGVSSVHSDGESGIKAGPRVAAVALPPGPVRELRADAEVEAVTLRWSPPADYPWLDGYIVYVWNEQRSEWDSLNPISGTVYRQTGLKGGREYRFGVAGVSIWGDAGPITAVTVTPDVKPMPVPAQVTGVQVQPRVEELRVTWTPLVRDGLGRYELEENGTVVGSYTGTMAQRLGLRAGEDYCYRVRGVNVEDVPGPWSDEVCGRPLEVPPDPGDVPPEIPRGITAAAGDGQVSLRWVPVTGAHEYRVEYRGGSGDWVQLTVTRPSVVVADLVNGQTYEFRLASVTLQGQSEWSGTVTATPVARQPGPAPTPTDYRPVVEGASQPLGSMMEGLGDGWRRFVPVGLLLFALVFGVFWLLARGQRTVDDAGRGLRSSGSGDRLGRTGGRARRSSRANKSLR